MTMAVSMKGGVEVSIEIESVRIDTVPDDDPDLSYLGKFQREPGADSVTIDRKAEGTMGRNEFRYFVAAMSAEDAGNPESVLQDCQRLEDYGSGWCMLGVEAVAVIRVNGTYQKIHTSGLWGVESDSGAEYLDEVGKDKLADLRGLLSEIGATQEQIDEAFQEVTVAWHDE